MHVRAHACLSRPSVVGVAATRGTFEGSVAPRKEPSRRVALPVCLQQKERLSTRESGQTWKNIYIYIYTAYVCDDRDSRLAHHRENHRPSQFLLFRSLLNSPSAIRFERVSLVMDGARSNSREVNLIRAKFRLISGSRLQSGRPQSERIESETPLSASTSERRLAGKQTGMVAENRGAESERAVADINSEKLRSDKYRSVAARRRK